jgi:hypothetical protein
MGSETWDNPCLQGIVSIEEKVPLRDFLAMVLAGALSEASRRLSRAGLNSLLRLPDVPAAKRSRPYAASRLHLGEQ